MEIDCSLPILTTSPHWVCSMPCGASIYLLSPQRGYSRRAEAIESDLSTRAAEAFFGSRRVGQAVYLLDRTGEDGNRDHLRDLISGGNGNCAVSEVGQQDLDFAAVT